MMTATRAVDEELQELDREIRADVAWMRRAQRALGRRLARVRSIARHQRVLLPGATTFELYCEQRGLSASEGHRLAHAALACADTPDLEVKLEEGRVSVESAALFRRVKDIPAFQREGDDWLLRAETSTTREFRNAVNERKEEERIGDKPYRRTLFLSRNGVEDLGRTRDLVARKTRKVVTESHAVEVALDAYVERHDPERKAARAAKRAARRRAAEMPAAPPRGTGASRQRPTRAVPARPGPAPSAKDRPRRPPAAERHAIVAMFGDRCWVAGCEDRAFLDYAHDRPFRMGGESDRRNCARYCRTHHRQFDAGAWKLRQGAGGPILVDRTGNTVGRLRSRPREPVG